MVKYGFLANNSLNFKSNKFAKSIVKLQPLDDKQVMFNPKLGQYYTVTCHRFFSANFHATFGGFFLKRFLDLYHFRIMKEGKVKTGNVASVN